MTSEIRRILHSDGRNERAFTDSIAEMPFLNLVRLIAKHRTPDDIRMLGALTESMAILAEEYAALPSEFDKRRG